MEYWFTWLALRARCVLHCSNDNLACTASPIVRIVGEWSAPTTHHRRPNPDRWQREQDAPARMHATNRFQTQYSIMNYLINFGGCKNSSAMAHEKSVCKNVSIINGSMRYVFSSCSLPCNISQPPTPSVFE